MKHALSKNQSNKIIRQFLLLLLIVYPYSSKADNTWSYHQQSDSLNNRTYSFAQSPMPLRGLYDNIRLEVICKDNALQFVVNADSLIASQNSDFDFEYQIDKNSPVKIQMKTSKDSKRQGYTEEYAQRIVNDLLTGHSIFVRISTMIHEVLSAVMPLENVAEPVKQVVADCGLNVSSAKPPAEQSYSLSEFEQEFAKLPVVQQQQVLRKIKEIVIETQKGSPTN